jgi:hypothetical protein
MTNNYPLPIPDYAVELLVAVKLVQAHIDPALNSPDISLKQLADAVERFEDEMPLKPDGEIFTVSSIQAHSNVVSFRALNKRSEHDQ